MTGGRLWDYLHKEMNHIGVKKELKPIRLRSVFASAVGIVVIIGIIFQGIIMLMVVPSGSMEPTISTGSLLIGSRNPTVIKRGDILVFQGHGSVMIKRVIGVSGELVIIQEDGSITIDNEPLSEPYVLNQREGKQMEFCVPDGALLFLGDNRTDSFDARYWDEPYISCDFILAKAEYIIFPQVKKIY